MPETEIKIRRTGSYTAEIGVWRASKPAGHDWWYLRNAETGEYAPETFESLKEALEWVTT